MIIKDYPCRKLIEWLLLEHRKKPWVVNKKMSYPRCLPHYKKYINDWIEMYLYGAVQLMASEMLKTMICPKTLESRYKKFHFDLWTLLYDPVLREQVELDIFFGLNDDEILKRLNSKITPRVIDLLALKQFRYFFWNLEDCNGVFRPPNVLELIESSLELSKAYRHILKYSNDKYGKIKYEHQYSLINSDEPNLININRAINLTAISQIEALEKGNVEDTSLLATILLKNAQVLKSLSSLANRIDKQYFSEIFTLDDK